MITLSKDPYKGTRDWYPADMRVRDYIFSTWRRTVESYGYEAYDAPLLEPVDVYAAKSGQEIVNEQTYSFVDRGDRHVAIRPELTPSVSRMIAGRRQEIGYPARWYNIGQFMRYERPQKGREREFWQCNIDMFGVDSYRADVEIIELAHKLVMNFGAKQDMFVIRLNNRKVINFIMHDYLQLDTVQSEMMIKLFDRKEKVSHEQFRDSAIDIFGQEKAPSGLKQLANLLSCTGLSDLPKQIREHESFHEVRAVIEALQEKGIKNIRFDITLMRGFDYYTGTVFEVFDTHPANRRAIFGGGRYDGLVGLFGAEPVSAIGMAPGLTMFEIFLREHKLLPELGSKTDLYIVVMPGAEAGAEELAHKLRAESVNVELDITGRKIDKQLKAAIKKTIPYIVFVGEEELRSDIYTFKDVSTKHEEKLSPERIVTTIRDYRHRSLSDDDSFDL